MIPNVVLQASSQSFSGLWSLLLIVIIVYLLMRLIQQPIETLHSNWNFLIENFKHSTKTFYELLNKEFQSAEIKGATLSDVHISEGAAGYSDQRHYLEIKYKGFKFLCCFAPFGNGSFVSWWLIYERSKIANAFCNLPFIGKYIERVIYPITFYKIDTASMFMRYVHNSVLRVIDDITKTKGVRMTENERTPKTHDLFGDRRRK